MDRPIAARGARRKPPAPQRAVYRISQGASSLQVSTHDHVSSMSKQGTENITRRCKRPERVWIIRMNALVWFWLPSSEGAGNQHRRPTLLSSTDRI
jgi:hypothetical protein